MRALLVVAAVFPD